MDRKVKVRLITDLTRYHPKLLPGAEGFTVGQWGMWSRANDRFVGVTFPGTTTIDVLWEGLEIIDEEVLREIEQRRAAKDAALSSATNVVLNLGPHGGFRYLSYEYVGSDGIRHRESTGSRAEAERLQERFAELGIPIKREVAEKRTSKTTPW